MAEPRGVGCYLLGQQPTRRKGLRRPNSERKPNLLAKNRCDESHKLLFKSQISKPGVKSYMSC